MMTPLDILAKNDPDKQIQIVTLKYTQDTQGTTGDPKPGGSQQQPWWTLQNKSERSFWSQKQMLCLEKGISRLSIEISPLHGTLGDIFLFLLSILFWHFRCESVFLPFVMPFCESIVHRQSSKVQYSRTTALSEDLPSYKIRSFKSQALS